MQNDITSKQINNIVKRRIKRNRWRKTATVLSSVAVFCTTYALIIPAITMERETYCNIQVHEEHVDSCYSDVKVCIYGNGNEIDKIGERVLLCNLEEPSNFQEILTCNKKEHSHDDSCYDQDKLTCEKIEHTHNKDCNKKVGELICTDSEHVHDLSCYAEITEHTHSDDCFHVHTESCFERQLTCTLPIHEHTLQCYSNPNLTESPEYWEESMKNVSLAGIWGDDLVSIAQSQVGYKESTLNYKVVDETVKGYTRYGDWYGQPYADWNTMFVVFCMNYARIDLSSMPFDVSSRQWTEKLTANSLFKDKEELPEKGDLIFIDLDGDGNSDHMGIVTGFDENTGAVSSIEGNLHDEVACNSYDKSDARICGYGIIPGNENSENAIAPLNRLGLSESENEEESDTLMMLLSMPLLASAKSEKADAESDLTDEEKLPDGPPVVGAAPEDKYEVTISVTALDGNTATEWPFHLSVDYTDESGLTDDEYDFTLKSDGTAYTLSEVPSGTKITVHESGHNGYSVNVKDGSVNVSDTDTVTEFEITKETALVFYNNPGVVLPSTGGIGTVVVYIAGWGMIAAAFILFIAKKRTEE